PGLAESADRDQPRPRTHRADRPELPQGLRFFFQAEDGIRDFHVTGVQTCALPISVREMGGAALVTADHGNADQMVDYDTGGPHTYHTTHPVPCILVSELKGVSLRDGRLADVAPTLLDLLGVAKPPEMDGETLIVRE